MPFPQMFLFEKCPDWTGFCGTFFVHWGGGGEQKSKKFGNGFFFLCLCISFDMKKRSGWCYFSTTPFIGHQQLKFRNPFFFSIFFLVRTQIQIRRKMNNGSKYYSSPTSLKRLKRPGNINNHSKRVYILNQKFFFFFPSLNNKRSPFCTPCLWLYNKNISASLSWNWNKITVFFFRVRHTWQTQV